MIDLRQCTVLIVDDSEINLDILVEALGDRHEVIVATDGLSALEAVAQEPPDLILLDVMMPGMDGFETLARLKADPATRDIPVVFLTALSEIENKTRGFELGAVDYVIKPFEIMEVQVRVRTHLSLAMANRELARQNEILDAKVRERTRQLLLTQEATVASLAVLAEYRDPETGGHINRIKSYVRLLAEKLAGRPEYAERFSPDYVDLLALSAPLHDIGKVGVPDHVLLKPGPLTPEETRVMQEHVLRGARALEVAEKKLGSESFLKLAKEIALTHHEKWDGTGYPAGLAGEEIFLSGRIMAVADVYDALISKRVYKAPMLHDEAVEIIRQGRGRHFDPTLVDLFLEHQEEFRRIALRFADHDEERRALAEPCRADHADLDRQSA